MGSVSRFFKLLNKPCRDMAGLMSRSLEEDLSASERFAVRLHMVYCTACRRYAKQLRMLRAILRRCTEAAADMGGSGTIKLSSEARARLEAAIKDR